MPLFNSSATCPVPPEAYQYGLKGTAHKPMLYVSGVAAIVTAGISLTLIIAHLLRYRCPKEQRQIVRLASVPVVYAAVSFCNILSYAAAQYIDPIGDVYESFCLCALLLLYLQFTAPEGDFRRGTFFENVRDSDEAIEKLNYDWPRITWVLVFQYPLTEILSTIILEATEAANDYCVQSLNPKFGHLWVLIISSVGIALAVMSILRFYGHTKSRMKVHRGIQKLVCFKLIVGIRFVQQTVFSILLSHNVLKPSNEFSYNDLMWGLPSTMTTVEMAILSLGFWYAYSSTEYGSAARPSLERMPIHKAALDALNLSDLIGGIAHLFKIALFLQSSGGFSEWRTADQEAKAKKAAQGGSGGGIIGAIGRKFSQGGMPDRYQYLDDTQSLSRPPQTHGPPGFQQETSYYQMNSMPGREMYQPPSNSPPSYEGQQLMAQQQPSRTPSPNGRYWAGQQALGRYPSPSDDFDRDGTRGKQMV